MALIRVLEYYWEVKEILAVEMSEMSELESPRRTICQFDRAHFALRRPSPSSSNNFHEYRVQCEQMQCD